MNGEFLVWDLKTGASVPRRPIGVQPPESCPDFPFLWQGRRHLAYALGNNDVCLWDLVKTRVTALFVGHKGPVLCVASFPKKGFLLTGSMDTSLRLWDIGKGNEKARFPHPDWVTCLAFSSDGKQALSGCKDKVVRLWQL
jgi:WD40 repeat protein